MTTINDIADLVRILRERPEWADTVRSILLSRELLELPERFAEFVEAVKTKFQEVDARFDRVETRLDRLEGRVGNLEGSDYERKVRYGVLHRVQDRFNLENAYLALTQNDPRAPQLNSTIATAIGNHAITREESEDLHNTDFIISDPGNYHVVVETSINADRDGISRAKRRAAILGRATGHAVMPAVRHPLPVMRRK